MHALHVMQGSSHNLWVIGKDLKLTRTGLLCTLKDENECNESLSENWKSFSSSVSPPCGGSKFVFVLRVSDSRYCGGLNWIGGGIISWPINKSKSNSEKKLSLFPEVFMSWNPKWSTADGFDIGSFYSWNHTCDCLHPIHHWFAFPYGFSDFYDFKMDQYPVEKCVKIT